MSDPGAAAQPGRRDDGLRWWLLGVLVLGAGWCAAAVLGAATPEAGALHASIVLLGPFTVAVAWARSRCGSAPNPRQQWDLVLLSPLVMATGLLQGRLGAPGSEVVAAAVLHATATLLLARSLPQLTRLLGRTDRCHALLVLSVGFYLLLTPWVIERHTPDGDEPWYLLVTHSIAFDLDTDLSDEYRDDESLRFMDRALAPQPNDPVGPEGSLHSRHRATLPTLLAPFYRVGGRTGATVAMALMTALLSWRIALLIRHRAPPGATAVTWLLVTAAAPLSFYFYRVWVEVPAALLLVLGYRAALALGEGKSSRPHLAVLVLAQVLLPALKIRFGLLSLGLVVVVLSRRSLDRTRATVLAGAGLVGLAAVLALNQLAFGNPLRIHRLPDLVPGFADIGPMAVRALGVLFDVGFGLFAFAPLWLLVLPGLWSMARQRSRILLDGVVLFAPYLLLVLMRSEWYGGWSPPFRYPLVALPFLACALAEAWAQRHKLGARLLLAPLALVTVAFSALWTAAPGLVTSYANGSARWVDAWTRATGVDWMRLLPSAVRPDTASVLVPLVSVAGVLLLWLATGRARSGHHWAGAGIVLLALTVALVSVAQRRLPTGLVQAESALVTKSGGHPEPLEWTRDRTRFREGWTLRNGERLVIPVRRDGQRLELEIALRFIRNRDEDLRLRLLADERTVAGLRLSEAETWSVERLGPVDWRDAHRLTLEVDPPLRPGQPGIVNGVAVDWIRFHWDG